MSGTATFDGVQVVDYGVLPISINNFRVENTGNKTASINWMVPDGAFGNLFTIERSADGINFMQIPLTVKSSVGNKQFTAIDNNPLTGVSYYRIKQSANNGVINYSSTVRISFNTYTLNVYPNPVHDRLFIHYTDDCGTNQKITIRIVNSIGKQVLQKETVTSTTASRIIVDMPNNIDKGIYLIQVTNARGEVRGQKIMVE